MALGAAGCGPTSRRDLGAVPQRQVTYDDMCRMQSHFDRIARGRNAHRPVVIEEQSTETEVQTTDEQGRPQRALLGAGTYELRTAMLQRRLRAMLSEEYEGVPPALLDELRERARVRLGWWSSSGVRRVRPDEPIEVSTVHHSVRLPFNPCIGELLFGYDVYALRRSVLEREDRRARGLPLDEPASSGASMDAGIDGGIDAGAGDAGDGEGGPG